MACGPAAGDDHILGTIEANVDGEQRTFYAVVAPELGPLATFRDFVLPGSLQFAVFGLRDPEDLSLGDILSLQFIERKSAGGPQIFESQGTGYQPQRDPPFPQYLDELYETDLTVEIFDPREDVVRVRLRFESQLTGYSESGTSDPDAPKLEISGVLDAMFQRQ